MINAAKTLALVAAICAAVVGCKKDGGGGGPGPVKIPTADDLQPKGVIKEESGLAVPQAELDVLHGMLDYVVGFDAGADHAKFASGEAAIALPRAFLQDPKKQFALFRVNPEIENALGAKVSKLEFANLLRFRDAVSGDKILNIATIPDRPEVVAEINKALVMLVTDTAKLKELAPGWPGVNAPGKYALYKTKAEALGFVAGKTVYTNGTAVGGVTVTSSASPFVAVSDAEGNYAMPNVPGSATLAGFSKINELYGEAVVTALSSDASLNVIKTEGGDGETIETTPIPEDTTIKTDPDTGAKSLVGRDVTLNPLPMPTDGAPTITAFTVAWDGTVIAAGDPVGAGPEGKVVARLTLSKAVDPATVTAGSFFMRVAGADQPLAITPALSSDNTEITLTAPQLLPATKYEVVATEGIAGAGGDVHNAYDPEAKSAGSPILGQTIAFDTIAAPYVIVDESSPANGAKLIEVASAGKMKFRNHKIKFSGSIDATTIVPGGSLKLICRGSGNTSADIDVTGTYADNAYSFTETTLDQDQTCTLSLSELVKDIYGIKISAPFASTFVTAAAPSITELTPASGATGVATDVKPRIKFSEAVTGFTAGSIALATSGGTAYTGTLTVAPVSGTTDTYEVTLSKLLDNATTYKMTIAAAGIQNGSSIPPNNDVSFEFTTEPTAEIVSLTLIDKDGNVMPVETKIDPTKLGFIRVEFTRDVAPASLSVIKLGTSSGLVTIESKVSDSAGNVVEVRPAETLAGGAEFGFVVPITVTDSRHAPIAAERTLGFMTLKVDPSRPGEEVVMSINFEDYDTSPATDALTRMQSDLKHHGWDVAGNVKVVNGHASGNIYDDSKDIVSDGSAAGQTPYQALFPQNTERQFLFLSTGKGERGSTSTAKITVDVPADAKSMVISYNFISCEYREWMGTIYNDVFTVKVAGETDFIIKETVNKSAWFGLTPGDNKNVKIVVGGINDSRFADGGRDAGEFDGQIGKQFFKAGTKAGDDIRVAEGYFDVSTYAGKQMTLVITVSDAGDTIYDSAALIDYIDFRKEAVGDLRQLALQ